MKHTHAELARLIDHSLLHPTLTDRALEEGCKLAARYRVASVCIKPYAVKLARKLLAGTGVKVGAVVGFPHGASATEVKRFETKVACRDGATEIDMVINIGKALSGDWDYVEQDIRAVVREAHRHRAIVKVIFENDYLPDDETKIRLCRICQRANADFVKTSTGYGFVKGSDGKYGYRGATEADLELMRAHASPKCEVKAAGGIRDLKTLIRCRELGVSRVGATATASMLDEFRGRTRKQASPARKGKARQGPPGY